MKGAKTCDCIEGHLDKYYNNFGFVKSGRVKWDDNLAPRGWNYEQYGRNDVVFFAYPETLSRKPNDIEKRLRLARAERLARNTGERGPLPNLPLHKQHKGFDWSLWRELDQTKQSPPSERTGNSGDNVTLKHSAKDLGKNQGSFLFSR